MSNLTVRTLIILATIILAGLIILQINWIRKAVQIEGSEFQRNINLALFEVAENYFEVVEKTPPTINPIIQSGEYNFAILVDGPIDANLLEILLKRSFSRHNLYSDFHYGIYNSSTQEQVFSKYVPAQPDEKLEPGQELPVFDNSSYYFGVIFPSRTSVLFDELQVWIYSTAVLVLVIIFFSYALFVVLKQKRLSEIQKDFVNNMTHEFRTPISTIEIAAGVLKDPSVADRPDRLLKYATIIENENQRLKKQVDRVLQIASLDKATIQLKKENTDIHTLLTDAADKVKSSIPESEFSLEMEAGRSHVLADPVHITNLIHNLIENAIKYSDGNPVIKISTENDDHTFTMNFRDKGIGISKEHQKNIFNKFYRVGTGDIHDVKGFGIGLHYVRLISEAHGGSVSLESELGKGSTFIIKLPL